MEDFVSVEIFQISPYSAMLMCYMLFNGATTLKKQMYIFPLIYL